MCGKETALVAALIEGSKLKVCEKCAKFGKIIKDFPRQQQPVKQKTPQLPTKEFSIKPDYAERIRQKCEALNIKQEDLAKMLAEKESLIHKLESGSFQPSLQLAKKIEKILGIVLIEEVLIEAEQHEQTQKSGALTIGDMLKVRK